MSLHSAVPDCSISFSRRLAEEQAQRNAPRGSGQVTEPHSEKELIQLLSDRGGELNDETAGTPIVVHFLHKEFRRCDIMNNHLEVSERAYLRFDHSLSQLALSPF